MATRTAFGIIGNGHPDGHYTDIPRSLAPGGVPTTSAAWLPSGVVSGTYGWVRVGYGAGSGTPFVANSIVTGSVTNARGRVIYDFTGTQATIEMLLPVGSPSGLAFCAGETLTSDDAVPKTAVVGILTREMFEPIEGGRPRDAVVELYSASLGAFVPADASTGIYWDRGAKKAATLPVASIAGIAQWARITGATSGAKALVTGYWSITSLAVVVKSGTFQNGELLDIDGGAAGVTVTTGTVTATTAGEFVPYHAVPGLNGSATNWEVPPGGSDNGVHYGAIGVEPHIAKFGYQKWGADFRLFKLDAYNYTNPRELRGGIHAGWIPCSGSTPTGWATGETLTAVGSPSWSAKLIAVVTGASGGLWVSNVNGSLAAGVVTGSTSGQTATATDNVNGWMKGAKHWLRLIDDIDAAEAKSGDTMDFDAGGMLVMAWEGDILAPAGSLNYTLVNRSYRQFAQDIRDELEAPDMKLLWWVAPTESRQSTRGSASKFLRQVTAEVVGEDDNAAMVNSDGLEMGAKLRGDFTASDEVLTTPGYLEIGFRAARAFQAATLVPSFGNLTDAPVVVLTGQSQLAGTVLAEWWAFEADPHLAKLPLLVGEAGVISTLDPDILIWNDANSAWEVYDLSTNANGWHTTTPGSFGPEVSLLARLKERYGRIYCLKLASPGSSMNSAVPEAAACWDPDGISRAVATASMTVTVPATNQALFTATAGTFSLFEVGEICEVAGSAASLAVGGNNTYPDYAPYPRVVAVASDGSTCTLEWVPPTGFSSFVAEGPRSFTLTQGPIDLRLLAEGTFTRSMSALVNDEGRIPRTIAHCVIQGENDIDDPDGYQEKLDGHIDWVRSRVGWRSGREPVMPSVIGMLSAATPLGTDAQVQSIRQQQHAVSTAGTRIALVDTSDLPVKAGTVWPPTERSEMGVHFTGRGLVILGYRLDAALDAFEEIPPHPNGAATAEFTGGSGGLSEFAVADLFSSATGGPNTATLATFVVETGDANPDSVSYCTVEFADAYHQNYGNPAAWASATVAEREDALRVGSRYLDECYGDEWTGARYSREQGLDWPRTYGVDQRGVAYEEDEIPVSLQRVTSHVALMHLQGYTLFPATTDGDIDSESLTSPSGAAKSITYRGGKSGVAVFPVVDRMVQTGGLVESMGGGWGRSKL